MKPCVLGPKTLNFRGVFLPADTPSFCFHCLNMPKQQRVNCWRSV